MSGGAIRDNGGGNSDTTQALQNYPIVPNAAGGAQASAAGANPQAQSLSQLQQALLKLGARGPQGQQSPAMQTAGLGMQMAQMGQSPAPMMPSPQGGRAMAPTPYAGAMPPQMMGGMGMPQGGMNIQQLNALLGQRTGLMG